MGESGLLHCHSWANLPATARPLLNQRLIQNETAKETDHRYKNVGPKLLYICTDGTPDSSIGARRAGVYDWPRNARSAIRVL